MEKLIAGTKANLSPCSLLQTILSSVILAWPMNKERRVNLPRRKSTLTHLTFISHSLRPPGTAVA